MSSGTCFLFIINHLSLRYSITYRKRSRRRRRNPEQNRPTLVQKAQSEVRAVDDDADSEQRLNQRKAANREARQPRPALALLKGQKAQPGRRRRDRVAERAVQELERRLVLQEMAGKVRDQPPAYGRPVLIGRAGIGARCQRA